MTSGACPACRAPVAGPASFCARCGSPLGIDVDLRQGLAAALGPPPEQLASPPRGRPSPVVLTVLAVAVVIAALVLGDCSGEDAADPRPTSTTGPTTTSTAAATEPSTSTTAPGATSTTGLPSSFAAPEQVSALGLRGTLYLLRADGELQAVDLADGRSTQVLAGGVLSRLGPTRLAVLGSAAVLGNSEGSSVALPFDGSPPIDLGYAWVAGSSPNFAVLSRRDATFAVVDGRGQELATFGSDVGNRAYIAGVAGGRAVLQAGGRIGLVDALEDTVEMVATGQVIAANDWGLVRIDCPALLSCQLAWGPWDDVDRVTVDARALPPDIGPGALSADGAALVVRSSAGWWLLGPEGETLLNGGPSDAQDVLPLGTGEAVAAQRSGSVAIRHVDGRVVTVFDLGTGAQVRRPVVALSYSAPR